ncbi:MAG: 2Fe-2S iron-sulfur cluster-binding protein [Rubrivivax sp.]
MSLTVHLIHPDGTRQDLAAHPGQTLMRVATDAGIAAVVADCGGLLTCATCHVYVAPEWAGRLEPVTPDESAMLEMTASPRLPNSRLSCQIVLQAALDGLTVTLPETQY